MRTDRIQEAIGAARHRRRKTLVAWLVAATSVVTFVPATTGAPAAAATVEATYTPVGPGPITNGQVENVAGPNPNEVAGAVTAIVAHPTDANTAWIGTPNGGVWRTNNATATAPTWTPQFDQQPSLSIGALELDPTVASNTVLVAGNARVSSFGRTGGRLLGLYRTVNGGTSWTPIGTANLTGENISGIAPRGATIVVSSSSNTAAFGQSGLGGIFRSTDTGATFTRLSGNAATGLPSGRGAFDLASDPSNNAVLYAGTQAGIFRSTDTGATWTNVTNQITGIDNTNTNNIELAVHNSPGNNVVYAGVINNGQLNGLWRSADQGANWTQMDTPVTNEGGTSVGLQPRQKPGSQGAVHFSIRADRIDPELVYVGGDRQPTGGGGGFPNSIGATDFTGRLFRCDSGNAANAQCTPLTHNGTPNNSAPHADSREMVFDANGDLIEGDDGGLYRRTDPELSTGVWQSMNGNLQITEHHSCAYDGVSDRVVCGNQDTGTVTQNAAGGATYVSTHVADGGFVAISDATAPSVRYTSTNSFSQITRRTCDAANTCANASPSMIVAGSGGQTLFAVEGTNIPLYPVLAINSVDRNRLVVGSASAYESLDGLNNLTNIGAGGMNRAVAYGGRSGGVDDAGVLWYGSGANLLLRGGGTGAASALAAWTFGSPVDVTLDPENWTTAYVTNGISVYRTVDAGQSFEDISGSLTTAAPNAQVWSLVAIPIAGTTEHALLAGTDAGVFVTQTQNLGSWSELGGNLPNTHAYDVTYDAGDDVLLVGTLGRGSWLLSDASEAVPHSNLSITKSDTPDPVKAGEEVFYTVTVTNDGPDDAQDVVVVDDPPDEVEFLEANGDACTFDQIEHQLTCTIAQIASGSSESFVIKTRVRSDAVEEEDDGTLLIENVATVASSSVDTDTSDNTAVARTFVQEASDLEVTKVCEPNAQVRAGDTAVCTIYVDNAGPSSARDVTLRDAHTSDGEFAFGSITATNPHDPAATCAAPVDGVITCDLGDIPAASPTETGRATVVIEISATERMDIDDVADATSPTPDPDPGNNQAQDTLSVQAVSDLRLDKSGPMDATAGTEIEYGISIANDGPSTAEGVVVEDTLSSGVEILSVAASAGASCNAGVPGDASLPTQCSFGTMAPGATGSVTIRARVLPDTRGTIHNDARVSSTTFDDDLADNLDTVATAVNGSADLSITKTDSPDPVVAGTQLTYTIRVTNSGPSTAEDVTITDTLPASTTFSTGVDGNGATVCALVQPGTVVCDLGDLLPGEVVTVYVTIDVSPALPQGSSLHNEATVSSVTADPNGANNAATADTAVDARADVWLDKQATSRSGNPSPIVTYTLVVHNNSGCETDAQSSPSPVCGPGGPSDATGIVVTDRLPLDSKKLVVQYVSPQCTYTKTTHTVVCRADRVPVGASVTFVIEAQVQGSVGTIPNTATLTTTTVDPAESNNTNAATLVMKGGTGKK